MWQLSTAIIYRIFSASIDCELIVARVHSPALTYSILGWGEGSNYWCFLFLQPKHWSDPMGSPWWCCEYCATSSCSIVARELGGGTWQVNRCCIFCINTIFVREKCHRFVSELLEHSKTILSIRMMGTTHILILSHTLIS
jgi:hypothetical protein